MQVSEIMTEHVQGIAPDTTVRDAAELMKQLDVGVLPVLDGGKPAGVITDRDIVLRSVAEGEDADGVRVGAIMSPASVTCRHSDDVAQVAQTMERCQVRRVLVLDDQGAVAGIVSLGDIAISSHGEALGGEVLKRVSQHLR